MTVTPGSDGAGSPRGVRRRWLPGWPARLRVRLRDGGRRHHEPLDRTRV